jgi:hypothetical protein
MACYGENFTFYMQMMFVHRRTHLWSSMACYGDSHTFYMKMMFVPHRTHTLWASMACYGENFTFLYADDVRTSQETPLWTSTACYRESFTLSPANGPSTIIAGNRIGTIVEHRCRLYLYVSVSVPRCWLTPRMFYEL